MPELQDIFAQYGEAYHLAHPLSPEQRKVVRAIQSCRTAALGGHVDECDECGFIGFPTIPVEIVIAQRAKHSRKNGGLRPGRTIY